MQKNILIIYTSIGKGHKVLGENIGAALSGQFNVDYLDILALEKGALVGASTKIYFWIINNFPKLWEFFYTNKVFLELTLPFRTLVASFKADKIQKILDEKKYDIVISMHAGPSSVMSYLKRRSIFKGKFVIAFSDYHLHRYWVFPNADLFLANIQEQKDQMVKIGVDPKKILVCGMTMQQKNLPPREELLKKYGLLPTDKVILFTSGTFGYKIESNFISKLLDLGAKVFVACGTNRTAYNLLNQKFSNFENIKIFGYIDFMSELFAVANVLIGKPGGLTIAEALQNRLPFAIINPLPGQEILNRAFLYKHQLVLPETEHILAAVKQELNTGVFAKHLQNDPYINELIQFGETITQALNSL